MREASLPAIFGEWAGKARYVQSTDRSGTKFNSACPSCGGEVHPNGDWPDRCAWWITSKAGKPLGYCFHCRRTFWPDGNLTDEDKAESRAYVQAQLDQRARRAQALADAFRDSRKWEMYHESMGEAGRAKWRRRGVPDSWQDFWQFGIGSYNVRTDDGWVTSPTLTIPLFDHDWNCRNVKHRLEIATDYAGKYRPEIAGQGAILFLCNPPEALDGHVIVVEGEIKAAVTFATLDDANVKMVGIPGVNAAPHIIEQLKGAERLTLVLDPGAEKQALELATALGRKKCRMLIPPMKIDDMILDNQLSATQVRLLLAQARSV